MSSKRDRPQPTNASTKLLNKRERRAALQLAEVRVTAEQMLETGQAHTALDMLLGLVEALQRDNESLLVRLQAAHRARFGRRTERLKAEEMGQLVLALGGTEAQAAASDPNVPAAEAPVERGNEDETTASKPVSNNSGKKRKHPGRTTLDPKLPRQIHLIPVPQDERNCQHCGTEMPVIGYVDHEAVEFIPAQILVTVERREKRACKSCEQDITTAERPATWLPERRAGLSLLAHLVEAKVDDALPIHRQQDQLRRLGFDAPVNTLYGYWDYATGLLEPLSAVIVSKVLAEAIAGIDDTRLDFLDPSAPHGKQRGHLWCLVGLSPLVGFIFTKTWSAEDIAPWLWEAEGFIQCDDYKGYGAKVALDDQKERVLVPPHRRLGCLMHVRRRYYVALLGGHIAAAVPIGIIKSIYEVEAEAKAHGLSPPERHELRQKRSLPLLDAFDGWNDAHSEAFLPKSPLGSAIRYARDQREFVRRCFSDGRFEIDNGRVERQIREAAVGRKNFLFSGSAAGARRLAAAYTVVLSARNAGLPVREYLIDVLGKLAQGWKVRRLGELVPGAWRSDIATPAEYAVKQAKQHGA